MGLSFEWDENKVVNNRQKHSVTFEEAVTVFNDPLSVTVSDPLHSESEHRFVILGQSLNRRLLVVVHTDRNSRIRIISVREAIKSERKNYEEKN